MLGNVLVASWEMHGKIWSWLLATVQTTNSGRPNAEQANKAQLSATVSSQTENIRTGLELVAKSKQTLLNLQRSFRVRCIAWPMELNVT